MLKCILNKKGSIATTTIFLLFGILAISLAGIEIIMSGLEANRAHGASAKAYYAAESGVERALMMINLDNDNFFKNTLGNWDGNYIDFNGNSLLSSSPNSDFNVVTETMGTGEDVPAYWVKVEIGGAYNRNVTFTATGQYRGTNRSIKTSFCVPTCNGKSNGDNDGCDGYCIDNSDGGGE